MRFKYNLQIDEEGVGVTTSSFFRRRIHLLQSGFHLDSRKVPPGPSRP